MARIWGLQVGVEDALTESIVHMLASLPEGKKKGCLITLNSGLNVMQETKRTPVCNPGVIIWACAGVAQWIEQQPSKL